MGGSFNDEVAAVAGKMRAWEGVLMTKSLQLQENESKGGSFNDEVAAVAGKMRAWEGVLMTT